MARDAPHMSRAIVAAAALVRLAGRNAAVVSHPQVAGSIMADQLLNAIIQNRYRRAA